MTQGQDAFSVRRQREQAPGGESATATQVEAWSSWLASAEAAALSEGTGGHGAPPCPSSPLPPELLERARSVLTETLRAEARLLARREQLAESLAALRRRKGVQRRPATLSQRI